MDAPTTSGPRRILGRLDGIAILVGVVLGAGVFRAPSVVAANVDSGWAYLGVWALGGLVTLAGALCYAELGAAYPHEGGEYRFLTRAYARPVGVLFAWARCAVIQPGAIAAVAFVYGDYLNEVAPLGPYGPALHAASAVIALTALNLIGTIESKTAQRLFTGVDVAALAGLILAGALVAPAAPAVTETSAAAGASGAAGLAMVFVLLTYGGWNEAAYLGGELREPHRNTAPVLLGGVALITALYLLVNVAFLHGLGLEGLRASQAPGVDLARRVAGEAGVLALTAGVAVAALSTLNGTLFTGARSLAALGRDLPPLRRLGLWSERGFSPQPAVLIQGVASLALVALGATTRDGFQAMVDYTAPVFWGFLLLVGAALLVLRRRDPARPRPFRAPVLAAPVFIAACAWLLWSSLAYTGWGALGGLVVLALGLPLLLIKGRAAPLT